MQLIILDPGHFHAALFLKETLPDVSDRVPVFAPVGADLHAFLSRVAQFNSRQDHPTHWNLTVHSGSDFCGRMLADPGGNVVVMSGNNRGKIDRIRDCVRAGLHVLADKPWIIEPGEFPSLQAALDAARQKGVVAYDAMTQRFEISCNLQRALVNDAEVFGAPVPGSLSEPSVRMESVHYLLKQIAGAPLLRPVWFFDIRQQGEGLTDVGTHLVDLVQWTLLPDQPIDFESEIEVLQGARWPTLLTREQFQRITGEQEFSHGLREAVKGQHLEYFANNRVRYTIRGIHVQLDIKWEYEAPPGSKDTELAVFRGTKSRVELRQGAEESFRPEVFVVPNQMEQKSDLLAALARRVALLQDTYPGLAVQEEPARLRLVIPDRLRIDHEAHFALLVRRYLSYVRNPRAVPAWEKSNMLAKYFVTTRGVELARQAASATNDCSSKAKP